MLCFLVVFFLSCYVFLWFFFHLFIFFFIIFVFSSYLAAGVRPAGYGRRAPISNHTWVEPS